MMGEHSVEKPSLWPTTARWIFLAASVTLLLLIVPIDPRFWFAVRPLHLFAWQQFFHLANYNPAWIKVPRWGIASYGNLFLALFVGLLVATLGFKALDRRLNYGHAYLWMRALVRYHLAAAAIVYGALKLLSLQFPGPSLSELNTNYGDFLQWKIYDLTVGVAKLHYQPTLGLFEIAGGLLLLWSRTATVGAALVAALLLNIVPANIAYQLGDHVYSTLLLIFASIIMLHDAVRLFRLLILERLAQADRGIELSVLPKTRGWARTARFAAFACSLLFVVSLLIGTHGSRWPFPDTPGIPNISGLYNVREFSENGVTMPYALVGSPRWQDVVFEPWNTFSIRTAEPMTIAVARPPLDDPKEQDLYEFAGNGGRHFYTYTLDSVNHRLHAKGKNDPAEYFDLEYTAQPDGTLTLQGTANGVALHAVLERIDKRYLLELGRRKPVNLY